MPVQGRIVRGKYFDSVSLMWVAREMLGLPGVTDAAAVMATDENKRILKASGMDWPELHRAGDTDLALGVLAEEEEAARDALKQAEAMLSKKKTASAENGPAKSRSVDSALVDYPEAHLVLISIAGKYAAAEAKKALQAGRHVMLFSDNVPLEQEVAIKHLAAEKGLLVMGPDCGTAIIGGVPLAFANVVRRGPIGIVAASGTGLQEVSSLIHNFGSGISHAIGTGGRDTKAEVGGITFLAGLHALKDDPETKVIVLVSKTPSPSVLKKLGMEVQTCGKPVVSIFLGAEADRVASSGAKPATTLEEAARMAVALACGTDVESRDPVSPDVAKKVPIRPNAKYLRGLFCGGTFSQEAYYLLLPELKTIRTNVVGALDDPDRSVGHTIIDMGGDEFTAGRPHPMIDYSLRNRRILDEARDPETAVILLDVVLGYGSNMAPAESLAPVFKDVCAMPNPPALVFHVCGTDEDPQDRDKVIESLKAAGGIYAESNADAVRLAAAIVGRANGGPERLGGTRRRTGRQPRPTSTGNTIAKEGRANPLDEPRCSTSASLLQQKLNVINVGIESFADNVRVCGGQAVHVQWRPPAPISVHAKERIQAHAGRIAKGNVEALEKLQTSQAVWVGMDTAINVIPGMDKKLFLHAGPPITWDRMCGPMRGALIGAVLYEGYAATPEEAEQQLAGGVYAFEPCHEHATVGPMAGVVSASMPVFIIENKTYGNRAFCTQNEGLGKVLRYGAYSGDVIERMKWMEHTLYPALRKAIERVGGMDLKNIIAQALHMGDEVHNRNRAGTSLLLRALTPSLVRAVDDADVVAKVIEFINGNDHFFLNLSMPACKVALDAARNTPHSSMLVAMSRNGTDFGIQLAGTGEAWFTGPALVPDALYFAGYSKDDANPDIGDSSITETSGLGGFAIAAAPAIVQFVGGSARDAVNYTLEMYEIAVGENAMYQIPALDFRGTPTGIDAIKVVEKGIPPFIDTGVAHKNPGVGQVGAGVVAAPMEPFIKAVEGLADTL